MTMQSTRRSILKGSLAVAGLSAFGIPEWALPAWRRARPSCPSPTFPQIRRRQRPIGGCSTSGRSTAPFTPRGSFFTTQHYGHPDVDPARSA